MIGWIVHEIFAFLSPNMVIFFYSDIFENGCLYLKVLIEYFQNMYRFNTIGHTVDEINAFEI